MVPTGARLLFSRILLAVGFRLERLALIIFLFCVNHTTTTNTTPLVSPLISKVSLRLVHLSAFCWRPAPGQCEVVIAGAAVVLVMRRRGFVLFSFCCIIGNDDGLNRSLSAPQTPLLHRTMASCHGQCNETLSLGDDHERILPSCLFCLLPGQRRVLNQAISFTTPISNERKYYTIFSTANTMPPSTFKIENAKSGRAKCKGCKELIAKDELRIVRSAYSETQDMTFISNYHTACFKVCIVTLSCMFTTPLFNLAYY